MSKLHELFEVFRLREVEDQFCISFGWKAGEFTDTWFLWELPKYNDRRLYRLDETCSEYLQESLQEEVVAVREYKLNQHGHEELISLHVDRICDDNEAIGINLRLEDLQEAKIMGIRTKTSRFMAQVSPEEHVLLGKMFHETEHYVREHSPWRLSFVTEEINVVYEDSLQIKNQ